MLHFKDTHEHLFWDGGSIEYNIIHQKTMQILEYLATSGQLYKNFMLIKSKGTFTIL